jgi:hypothetical protein
MPLCACSSLTGTGIAGRPLRVQADRVCSPLTTHGCAPAAAVAALRCSWCGEYYCSQPCFIKDRKVSRHSRRTPCQQQSRPAVILVQPCPPDSTMQTSGSGAWKPQ